MSCCAARAATCARDYHQQRNCGWDCGFGGNAMKGALWLAAVWALVACRTAPNEPVGAVPAHPMLGIGSVADEPTMAALPPCQVAAEVVAARATQTMAEAMMERALSQQVISMLRRVVQARCTADAWSAATLTCYREATVDSDPMVVCADQMSSEQLQALTAEVGHEMDTIRAAMH